MNRFQIFFVLLILFGFGTSAANSAEKSRFYALTQTVDAAKEKVTLRLRSRKTDKLLWLQHVWGLQPQAIEWSKDGRALAIGTHTSGIVWVWRVGVKPREFWSKGFDSEPHFTWSPDNQRLLIHGWNSLDGEGVGGGTLICLNLQTTLWSIIDGSINIDVKWIGRRTFRYYRVVFHENKGVYSQSLVTRYRRVP